MAESNHPKTGAVSPLQVQAPEAMAAFSAACLLTLALIPPPLGLAGKISACLFSIALTVLLSARVSLEFNIGEKTESLMLGFSQRVRFYGYAITIVALVSFLVQLYWLASLAFILTALMLSVAYLRASYKARMSAEKTTQQNTPTQTT
jgi:hypothetical protein